MALDRIGTKSSGKRDIPPREPKKPKGVKPKDSKKPTPDIIPWRG